MVRSQKMDKDVPVTIVTPDSYDGSVPMPVLYLLNGWSGDHRHWLERGKVGCLADRYEVILVMPDTGYDSWYFDSKVTPEYQYETFVSNELVEYVDSNYKTIADRCGRAVTGLSMGGRHTQYIGFRNPELFGSLGILSAALTAADEKAFGEDAVAMGRDAKALKDAAFDYIFIGAGVYETNDSARHTLLHKQLEELGVKHDYYIGGFSAHDFMTWRHLLYFQFMPNLWK